MKRLLLLLLTTFLLCGAAKADTTAIINSAVETGRITRADVRALFLMKERRFDDGQRVVIFQLPRESRLHRQFVREVLEMTPEQYARAWDKIVNAGLSTYIRSVTSSEQMFTAVARTASGLGYVDSSTLMLNNGANDVKILKIID